MRTCGELNLRLEKRETERTQHWQILPLLAQSSQWGILQVLLDYNSYQSQSAQPMVRRDGNCSVPTSGLHHIGCPNMQFGVWSHGVAANSSQHYPLKFQELLMFGKMHTTNGKHSMRDEIPLAFLNAKSGTGISSKGEGSAPGGCLEKAFQSPLLKGSRVCVISKWNGCSWWICWSIKRNHSIWSERKSRGLRLLQCTVHRATFVEGLKTASSPEYSW